MMHTVWRARVRREYVWPYPALEPHQWYDVRSKDTDEEGWCWLLTRPTPTYVCKEHVELREFVIERHTPADLVPDRAASTEAPVFMEEREARLKPNTLRRYGGIVPGVWMRARDLLAIVRPRANALPGERRRRRLPPADFEFRDVLPASGDEWRLPDETDSR